MRTIYLDNNASTQVAPEVIETMLPFFYAFFADPSSPHSFGALAARKVEDARRQVADLLKALPEEIIFTSGASESNNAALRSAMAVRPGRRHMVMSAVEHPAVLSLATRLEREGCEVTRLPVGPGGGLDLDLYAASLRPDTAVVSLMWANHETGVVFPVVEAARIARERGILFHTDAVQAVGRVDIGLTTADIDMLSLSGHTFHGPKGSGVLYVKQGTPFVPFHAGGRQEGGRRAGTENVPAIIGLGKASQLARQRLHLMRTRVRALRDRLEDHILATIPHARRHGDAQHRLPNTTCIGFEGLAGPDLLRLLDEAGICAACGSGSTDDLGGPSHVLAAMGVPAKAQPCGSVGFSLSHFTTDEEIDAVLRALAPIIARLRAGRINGRPEGVVESRTSPRNTPQCAAVPDSRDPDTLSDPAIQN